MKAKKMQTKRVARQFFCVLLAAALLCVQLSALPRTTAVADTATTSVNFDPNGGAIRYGCVGDVGAGPEYDLNNDNREGLRTIVFPDDLIKYFEDYDPQNPYYDHAPLMTKAIDLVYENVRADKEAKRDVTNTIIFCKPGVYYFRTSVALGGYNLVINGVYGETVFVAEPNYVGFDGVESRPSNGFFTNSNFSNEYSWLQTGCITDLTIVAAEAHPSFKPTSTAKQIMDNVLSSDVKPVSQYHAFYRINMKYFALTNLTISGFDGVISYSNLDMLARLSHSTFGPTRFVLNAGTNDAFVHDNYFFGGHYTNELGLSVLPTFANGFSLATTYVSNCYLENYIFTNVGTGQAWSPYGTYSNLTMNRVYSIGMDTTITSGNSMSGCLIQNCGYNDIKAYFESKGLKKFNYNDRYWANNKWNYPTGYAILRQTDRLGGIYDDAKKEHPISIFHFTRGNTVTQNKIVCNDMENTSLIQIQNGQGGIGLTVGQQFSNERYHKGIMFTDNAFDVKNFKLEDLVYDELDYVCPNTYPKTEKRNNKVLSAGWSDNIDFEYVGPVYNMKKTVDNPNKPMCWINEDGVYISPEINRYIDISAFLTERTKKAPLSVGYTKPVGVDESRLSHLEKAYYNDLQAQLPSVFLKKDFGGKTYGGSSYTQLQRAFDYAATHDAILYIDAGKYYTDKPIVLRGGAHYRVVFDGVIIANKTTNLQGNGVFVMSADDNAPISGYFYNTRVNMNAHDTSGFYNVNFKDMWISSGEITRGQGGFTNCNFNDSILANGQINYCDRGILWRTTFEDSVFKNIYITGSTFNDPTINDATYRTYFCETDLIDSTMRSNWFEFGQFSDGKKLTGEGNTLYRGNLLDYTYNYSFGENDVFVGNTQSRAAKGNIVGHMTGSSFPIDEPDALKNSPMIMYHISNGVKVIGNALNGTMSPDTHFVEFDSPTIRYRDAQGNEVVSISNARVVANLAFTNHIADRPEWVTPTPIVAFDNYDNMVYENCLNNQLLMQTVRLRSDGNVPMQLSKALVLEWAMPGADLYIDGVHHVFNVDDYVKQGLATSSTPKQLTRVPATTYPQTEIWEVGNYYTSAKSETEVKTYNFINATDKEAKNLKDEFAKKIGLVRVEPKSTFKEAVYDIVTDIDGNKSFHIDSTVNLDNSGNPIRTTQKPGYSLIFDLNKKTTDNTQQTTDGAEQNTNSKQLVSAKMSVWQDMQRSFTWTNNYPTYIIFAEDATKYYGVSFQVELYRDESDSNRASLFHIDKNTLSIAGKGTIDNVDFYRSFQLVEPATGYANYNLITADYLNKKIFAPSIKQSDCEIWGLDIECAYNPDDRTVNVSVVMDLSYRGKDTSFNPPAVTTTRIADLGTFSLNDANRKIDATPVFGYFSNWEAWVESVELVYTTDTPSECAHSFTSATLREATCTKHGVVENTCTKCDYKLLEKPAALGHKFVSTYEIPTTNTQTPYIKHACSVCDFAYHQNSTVASVEVSQSPKINYVRGESLNVSTGKLTATFTDGSKFEAQMASSMISGFDSSSTGTKTLTVTYFGATTTYDINVTDTYITAPKPEVYFVGWDKIVVNTVPGYLYSIDRVNWQSRNTFTGLASGKQYSIYSKDVSDTYSNRVSQATNVTTIATGSTPTAPSKTNSLFSGWKINDGNYTSKFVNKAVLCSKVQLSNNSTSEKAAIRLLSTIDSLKYNSAGFIVKKEGAGEKKIEIRTVYSEIRANGSAFNASKVSGTADSSYIICLELANIPKSEYNTPITFTPFWTTTDGLTIQGTARTVKVADLMK